MALPEPSLPVSDTPVELGAGALKLRGPEQGRAWNLSQGKVALGFFHALMHQRSPGSLWVASDTARITALRETEQLIIVDMELSRTQPDGAITRVDEETGEAAEQTESPRTFVSFWRFRIPKDDGAWFAAQCLSILNTDDTPWTLDEVFYYLKPALGGDDTNDGPLSGEVPNYFRPIAAWVDKDAGLGIACRFPEKEAFQCNYWKDPGGGFHSDMRQRVDHTLQPGESVEVDPEPVFFYAVNDLTLKGVSDKAGEIEKRVRAGAVATSAR
jgi:hypothetical protein